MNACANQENVVDKIVKMDPNMSLAPPDTNQELIFLLTLSIANVLKALISKCCKKSWTTSTCFVMSKSQI